MNRIVVLRCHFCYSSRSSWSISSVPNWKAAFDIPHVLLPFLEGILLDVKGDDLSGICHVNYMKKQWKDVRRPLLLLWCQMQAPKRRCGWQVRHEAGTFSPRVSFRLR